MAMSVGISVNHVPLEFARFSTFFARPMALGTIVAIGPKVDKNVTDALDRLTIGARGPCR